MSELLDSISITVHPTACAYCGGPLGKHARKYCSGRCAGRGAALAMGRKLKVRECRCQVCGVAFTRKNGGNAGRCCSRKCGFELLARNKLKRLSDQQEVIEYRAIVSHLYECKFCKRAFPITTTMDRYCSTRCSTAMEQTRKHPDRYSFRPCAHCGSVFAPEYGSWRTRFCSTGCAKVHAIAARKTIKLEAKRRRRARLKRVVVLRFPAKAVFERDGYVCGICKQSTDPSKKVPHPRAPTLDHIIPLSRGGPHTLDNTQCACFICNSIKSDSLDAPMMQPSDGRPGPKFCS